MSEKEKPTGLALLRVSFPESSINKLPKPMCSLDEWKKLPKAMCKECGAYHATSKTIHLDYIGHAALTDRLLDADPSWSWEPLAVDASGYPVIDKDGGMWIKLTVCGVTRLGYGDAQGKTGGNAMKERIGDALRNAAMRFGAGLELWHKGELKPTIENDEPEKEQLPPPPKPVVKPFELQEQFITDEQKGNIVDMVADTGTDVDKFLAFCGCKTFETIPAKMYKKAMAALEKKAKGEVPA